MMESGLVYHSYEFDTFMPFLIYFVDQLITKIGGSNCAGFCPDNHIAI